MPRLRFPERDDAAVSDDDLAGGEGSRAKSRAPAKAGVKRKAPIKTSRAPLSDRTNVQTIDDEDEVEKPKTKRLKVQSKSALEDAFRNRREASAVPETQREASVLREIPQTQQRQYTSPRPAKTKPVSTFERARSTSVQPGHVQRDRSASASGGDYTNKSGDIEIRRQLTTMTRECERLNLKSQTLEDLVRDKAESNFDKLKREADLKTKQADELIAALKQELSAVRKSWSKSSSSTESVQAQFDVLKDGYEHMERQNAELVQELAAAKQSLHAVENERKSLEAKLVAARQQLTSDSTDRKPGARSVGIKTTEAEREAKMKESLYTDLTGLIIRGVKRKDGEDEYDCIQTGRNGTLHFHLSVANETVGSHPKTPGLSYEDAEFSYEPLLDESRDRDLLEVLPDYLSEDICFPRNHAVKFYAKVAESMMKRIVVEDD